MSMYKQVKLILYLILFISIFIIINSCVHKYSYVYAQQEEYEDFTVEKYSKYNEVAIKKYNGSNPEVVIPNEIDGYPVTQIAETAFKKNINIVSVNIPNSVRFISSNSFEGCKKLETVNIPSSIIKINDKIFYGCISLNNINIPDSVTEIGRGAFCGCTSLTNIELSSGISSITSGMFMNCTSLTRITIPSGVTSIEYNAFAGSGLTSITIPDSVVSIDESAFYNCRSLTSITIPDSVTSIGEKAFYGCKSLNTAYVNKGSYVEEWFMDNIPMINIIDISLSPTSEPFSIPIVSATPTSTPMSTATPTSTPTSTPTAVPTATPTSTQTAVPTATPTSTTTATPTSTQTAVPTATPTSAQNPTPASGTTPTPDGGATPQPDNDPNNKNQPEYLQDVVSVTFGEKYSNIWSESVAKNYKIDISKNGILNIYMTKLTNPSYSGNTKDPFEVLIYDSSGKEIFSNNTLYASKDYYDYYSINVGLCSGTYYCSVKPKAYFGTRTLSSDFQFSFNENDYCEIEPNDDKETATPMKLNKIYKGYLGSDGLTKTENSDLWCVDLVKDKRYKLTVFAHNTYIKQTCTHIIMISPSVKYYDLSSYLKSSSDDTVSFIAQETGKHYIKFGLYFEKQYDYKLMIEGETEEKKDDPNDKQTNNKEISVPGVGIISADGRILTDTDGDKYLIAEKISSYQLVKNTSIADKSSAGKYKITKVTKKKGKITGGTVTYMKPYNKNSTLVVVKDTVKLGGVKFKVTVIANNAFKGSMIKKLTIGKYITKIGKNAANGCVDLKDIKIKSKVLKKIGSKAFKGINAKAKFKVSAKNKVKKYKKMIKKAGAPKTVKYK